MSAELDAVMERASRALGRMDYLESETLCLEGLRVARGEADWVGYTRVLMPLQECRRQRRMLAVEAGVQLGTAGGLGVFAEGAAGCVAVTSPLSMEDARRLAEQAGRARRHVEALWCPRAGSASESTAEPWRVSTTDGSEIACEVPAPRGLPLNVKLTEAGSAGNRDPRGDGRALTAGHWFVAASEALGDAALAAVEAELGTLDRVEQLERMVAAVGDHEKLHQRLNEAVRALVPGLPASVGAGVSHG